MPRPPEQEDKPLVWPYWPLKLRTSSSHEEGCERDWAIVHQGIRRRWPNKGKVKALKAVRLEWKDGKMSRSRRLRIHHARRPRAAGHGLRINPLAAIHARILRRRERPARQRQGQHRWCGCYTTSVPKIFAAGDIRRGQSLVVWAIREGRQCATRSG
jgi:glutamate synthase (NADPH/NADH) small chain